MARGGLPNLTLLQLTNQRRLGKGLEVPPLPRDLRRQIAREALAAAAVRPPQHLALVVHLLEGGHGAHSIVHYMVHFIVHSACITWCITKCIHRAMHGALCVHYMVHCIEHCIVHCTVHYMVHCIVQNMVHNIVEG